ncbi:flagellar basal body rod protein [Ectobacillus antri]|uniref:Flagellar basal body rod protein n=1 Tax=Ectobacillus antri TaxID=2486280 RepID=A0ABT6H167_9BACI|nr:MULTISPECIES: flagellar basal body rod protein [Ectobacillus]MDG4656032.1 flagellar basal body rod protein [Ectobacillus antri]MDG5752707.1 flagellar basal body rod protein [Ectobacillus antri]UOY93539.1 flagellar basal body rod protein [Ectobacillus sp. JY-23]
MKKFLTILAAGILVLIAFASLGHLIGFGIGAALCYWSCKSMLRAKTVLSKLGWGILGLVGLSILFGNFPAIIGMGAIALLYYGYKSRNKKEEHSFQSFDEEWEHIMKTY